jgi:Fe2+ transport system protein FeoA
MKYNDSVLKALDSVQPGESAVIVRVASSDLTPKMAEMGVFTGKEVKVLFKAPFGGPIAVDLGGYVLSMRREEAHLVSVEPAI